MKIVYMINDTVVFEPEKQRLCALRRYPEQCIVLHGPVSECLLQLLQNNEQVVTQRFLLEIVWGKRGVVVSTNALYQTIASVRKGLKLAGIETEIIKTIPKAGFKSVAKIRKGTFEELFPLVPITPSPSIKIGSNEVEAADKIQRNNPILDFFHSDLAFKFAGIIFLLSCLTFYLASTSRQDIFASYHSVGNIQQCRVYSSWINIGKSIDLFKSLSSRYPVNCNPGDIAYMSVNGLSQRVSLIVCNQKPEKSTAICLTIIYRM